MNCLEFRRAKLADPRRLPDAAQAHARDCAQCAGFARGVDDSDADLARAMSVPVPEGLADRVLLGAGRAPSRAWRALALAASVVLGIGLVALSFLHARSDAQARLAVAHVVDEPQSFTMETRPDVHAVAAAFRSVGAALNGPLGKVRYLKLCPWEDGVMAWHLVVETPHGLATLLLVPDANLRARSDVTAQGWSARVQPARRGFYAVVTPSAEATRLVGDILRSRVDWNA